MFFLAYFITREGFQTHGVQTVEDAAFDVWIFLFKGGNQVLDLKALRIPGAVPGCVIFSKAAGTLEKFKIIVTGPGDDVILTDAVQGSDKGHPLEISAVKLRHHALEL